MNPGKLNRRLTLLRAAGEREVVWGEVRKVWAAVTEGKTGLIAPNAVKTPAIEAVIRGLDVTEADALTLAGEHYLITGVLKTADHPVYLKVTAVQSPVYTARLFRSEKRVNGYGATVWEPAETGTTVCCLSERYIKSQDARGRDETDTGLLMVTPKLCTLGEGDSVEVLSARWKVTMAYTMDRYKNRYQIERVKDN